MNIPYELRDYQKKTIDFITRSISSNVGAAVESPTGSGKTLMGLISAMKYVESNPGCKILYLTRTNSQQEQVITELREINRTFRIKALPFQGRGNLCTLYHEIEGNDEFNSESLSKFCSARKKKVMAGNQKACRFFNEKVRSEETSEKIFSELPTAEQLYRYGIKNVVCPYESLKSAMTKSDVVVAPYAFFLNVPVAERFLNHWGVTRDNLVVVMDEAHNLPDLAREVSSFEISVNQINMAEKEAVEFGDIELMPRVRASDFTEMIRSGMLSLVDDRLEGREDTRIRFDEFREYVMMTNSVNSEKFRNLIVYLSILGEDILSKKENEGKVPRSRVNALAERLQMWEDVDDDRYVAILSNRKNGSIVAFCLDPSLILSPLKESKTIHMSGTLEPVEIYKNVTGFQSIKHRSIPYMFPDERRSVIYYEGVTTKFDEFDRNEVTKMRDLISELVNTVKRNSIVFFPSYSTLDKVAEAGFDFPYLSEKRGSSQVESMDMVRKFRKGGKPILAVAGGKLSEGMNFPGKELEMVIIAGIPYPRPDARQRSVYGYYEHLYRRGWEYSVTFPTLIKLKQEIGRLIRTEEDTGMAVILDKRASYFRSYIPFMMLSEDPVRDAFKFFNRFE
ncbi:MAG TPA: ATP-dependent DNA helicase [Thermoplasmataceae archaeon]|nr:ATP-dependent DNA helicase [Thermoplasmataceae archaeon]